MSRSLTLLWSLWFALLCAGGAGVPLAEGATVTQPPPTPPAGEAGSQPADEVPSASEDPAIVQFDTEIGMLLVPVKAVATTDYEAMIRVLQAALAASADPERRKQAAGWRVFKAAETDAKGQALYVHLVSPVVPATDYRPSAVLDALVDGAPEDLLVKYREAHAGPPSKISLTEIANMALAPAPLPPADTPAAKAPPGTRKPPPF